MNTIEKGNLWEKDFSRVFHAEGIPLLLSPLVMRAHGAGQVDFARLEWKRGEWSLCLAETKVGSYLSPKQRSRLVIAASFLRDIFHCPLELKYFLKEEEREKS